MTDAFFEKPILNSPYLPPTRHWELDEAGQPTQRIADGRRKASFVTPIPKAKKQTKAQTALILDEGKGLSTSEQQYDIRSLINELRIQVERWRELKNPDHWRVTPETRAKTLCDGRVAVFGEEIVQTSIKAIRRDIDREGCARQQPLGRQVVILQHQNIVQASADHPHRVFWEHRDG